MSQSAAALLTLLISAILATALAWRMRWPRPWVVLSLILLLTGAVVALFTGPGELGPDDQAVLSLLALVLAVAGGGPLTVEVFALVDGPGEQGRVRRAGEVLRGGAWIGSLERAAVALAVLAGWPEGLALALAVKGLGRYPELRNQDNSGTAERFLIGTFTSVLWAVTCAGVVRLAS